jgi:hypothetical protein
VRDGSPLSFRSHNPYHNTTKEILYPIFLPKNTSTTMKFCSALSFLLLISASEAKLRTKILQDEGFMDDELEPMQSLEGIYGRQLKGSKTTSSGKGGDDGAMKSSKKESKGGDDGAMKGSKQDGAAKSSKKESKGGDDGAMKGSKQDGAAKTSKKESKGGDDSAAKAAKKDGAAKGGKADAGKVSKAAKKNDGKAPKMTKKAAKMDDGKEPKLKAAKKEV